MKRNLLCLCVGLLASFGLLVPGCGSNAPCDGDFGTLTTNPDGNNCTKVCECSNQYYEGTCVTGQGNAFCRSQRRDSCATPGLQRSCLLPPGTKCQLGVQECQPKGLLYPFWGDCKPIAQQTEEKDSKLCSDGLDNDCDGKVDLADPDCKSFCSPGAFEPCYSDDPKHKDTAGKGECRGGYRICQEDGSWSACTGAVVPTTEVCNQRDDDCDGSIDNKPGTTDKLPDCSCWPPGSSEACYTGPDKTEKVGICKGGTRFCTAAGTWSACLDQRVPTQETCNLQDDDCDGNVDNTPGQQSNLTRECFGSDLGCNRGADGKLTCKTPCQTGSQTCIHGSWTACQGQILPQGETCNGIDDDCNGKVDDNIAASQARLCPNQRGGCRGSRSPVSLCIDGVWRPCRDRDYADHFKSYNHQGDSCDGLDNDCDGQVDEGNAQCVSTFAGQIQGYADGLGTAARFGTVSYVARDSKGNLYVADRQNHLIRKIDVCGNVTTFAGNGAAGRRDGSKRAAQFNRPNGLAIDNKDNLYVADTGNFLIRKIDPDGNVSTLAGNGNQGYKDDNASNAEFGELLGIAVDSQTRVYVGEFDGTNVRIRRINKQDSNNKRPVTTIINGARGNVDGNATQARFAAPTGMAFDTSDNLYVADSENHTIRKIDTSGNVTTIAGSGSAGHKDDTGKAALFNFPRQLAFDSTNNLLYVTDRNNHRLRKIDLSNNKVTTLVGTSAPGSLNGKLDTARFSYPDGILIDDEGNLTIADRNNYEIRKVLLKAGRTYRFCITTAAGTGRPGSDNSPAAAFNGPANIAVDTNGNVYVADRGNHRIRKIDTSGIVSTLAGSRPGALNGTGPNALFQEPSGIAVDTKGNLYIADTGNHRIRKISPDGIVSTLAGGSAGYKDGPSQDAQFSSPVSLTIDPRGNLYIVDAGNHTIRKIDTKGNVTTLAGNGQKGNKDGKGKAAQFNQPSGITLDDSNNLYIADTNNNLVRKLTPEGDVTTFAGLKSTLNNPAGIAFHPIEGTLYIYEKGALRKIDTNGNVSPFISQTGYTDGPISNAAIGSTQGYITIDPLGNIYLSDPDNSTIRRIPAR